MATTKLTKPEDDAAVQRAFAASEECRAMSDELRARLASELRYPLYARIAELEAVLNQILDMRTVGGGNYFYADDVRAIAREALQKSNKS